MFAVSGSFIRYLGLRALLVLCGVVFVACGVQSEDADDMGYVEQSVCTAASLSGVPTGPQAPGAVITLTADGTACGMGETAEYLFMHKRAGANPNVWTIIRTWGTSPTTNWNTTGLPAGTYAVGVQIRHVGATAVAATRYITQYLGSVCNNVTAFTADPESSQNIGQTVNLSAAATCTGGTPEFAYYARLPGASTYTQLRGYGAAAFAWNTTGFPAGVYTLQVWTRAVGNSSSSEAIGTLGYSLNPMGSAASCTSAGINPSPAQPVTAGTQVTLTGTSAGCSSPQYAFYYRLLGTTAYTLIRGFAAGPATWNTTGLASGTYQLRVEARATGHVSADVITIVSYGIGAVCPTLTVNRTPTSPQQLGTPVTFTGVATCSTGASAEYRYLYKKSTDSAYSLLRDFGPAVYVWDTADLSAGAYSISVQARGVGSTAPYDSSLTLGYTLTAPVYAQISAGLEFHTCGATTNGIAFCWGQNDQGQLGNGTLVNSSIPRHVTGITGVTQVVAGKSHSCALLNNQTVRCWGDNTDAQLGNNSTTDSSTPVTVSGITDAIALSAGTLHTCALRSGGTISCWGNNSYSQFATVAGGQYPVATPIPGVTGVTAISSGGWHQCALLTGGDVQCWGSNDYGQVGDNSRVERKTPLTVLAGASSVTAGDSHTCAVVGGGLRCWGYNFFGQLGSGGPTDSLVPVAVPGVSGVSQAAPGYPFTCARSSGSVSCWGHGIEGELGQGANSSSSTPVSVSGVTNASQISAGGTHTCIVRSTGAAACWGYNASGQLGNGTTTNANTPVVVSSP